MTKTNINGKTRKVSRSKFMQKLSAAKAWRAVRNNKLTGRAAETGPYPPRKG